MFTWIQQMSFADWVGAGIIMFVGLFPLGGLRRAMMWGERLGTKAAKRYTDRQFRK